MNPSPRKRPRTELAAAAVAVLLLSGCGTGVASNTGSPERASTVTVSNCGREIAIAGVPEAAVGMHPAQTELMLRLGLADRLVGQAQAVGQPLPADVAGLAEDIPVIGGAMPPSREDLLAVGPDFVYSPTMYEFSADQGFASIDQLQQAGSAVYVAAGGCEDRRMTGQVVDLFTDLENLGAVFGVEERAAELIAESEAELQAVAAATRDVSKLRVAQVYVEGDTLQAIGAGVEYDILRLAGADNVYTPDQAGFADFFASTITPESLAAEQPEALVFAVFDEEHEAATRAYLTSTFPDMPAVRDGRLIALSPADLFPGTLGNITAVRQLAEQLYPEAF